MVVSAGSLMGNRSPAIDMTPFSLRHGFSPKSKKWQTPFSSPPLSPASIFRSESRLLRGARNDRGVCAQNDSGTRRPSIGSRTGTGTPRKASQSPPLDQSPLDESRRPVSKCPKPHQGGGRLMPEISWVQKDRKSV